MTALDVKDDILLLLSRERNPANLERIRAFIASIAFEEDDEADWWDDMPEEQQQRLLAIIKEVRGKKNLISNEDARENLKRWAS